MMAVQTDIQDFEGTIAYQIDTVKFITFLEHYHKLLL